MTQTVFAALFLVTLVALPVTVVLSAIVALWPSHLHAAAAKPAAHAAAHA